MSDANPINIKESVSISICSRGMSLKEKDGEYYSEGFICTTHIDRAQEDGADGTMLTKEACEQIVNFINSGKQATLNVGNTRTVSYRHDWVKENNPNKEVAGMAMPPAELRETDDGQYGVWCTTHHNKLHSNFDNIKYEVEHNYIPGYSIEFKEGSSFLTNVSGKVIKVITGIADFFGYAFANARMIANPNALIKGFGYREIMAEVSKMSNENIKIDIKETSDVKVEAQVKEMPKIEEPIKVEIKETVIEEPVKIETKESAETKVSEIVDKLRETPEYKQAIEDAVKSRVIKGQGETMDISIKEMKDAISSSLNAKEYSTVSLREAMINHIDATEGRDFLTRAISDPNNYVNMKTNIKYRITGKGIKIADVNVRSTLGTTSNQSSYTQASVEFPDAFAPGILDTFNNRTDLFGFLKKENWTEGNYYQWKIITNRDPSSVSTFVNQNDTSVTKNYSNKLNLQTPIKIARRGISVTDFINRHSARSLGDLFMLEVEVQMNEMMVDVDAALFAEVADGTNESPLGLEAVADSAGNTTLYGLTRSTANRLSPASATDTYTAVQGGILTEAILRNGPTRLEIEGTMAGNIAYVTSPQGRDFIMNLFDGNRRFNTVDVQFGFTKQKVASMDGYPIIVDPNCNSDAIYVIDTESDVIVVSMAPQITNLAKVGAATEAYIEMDFAHVYKQPRRIHMIDVITSS